MNQILFQNSSRNQRIICYPAILNQKKYAYELLERAHLLYAKSVPNPMVTHSSKNTNGDAKIDER